MNLSPNQREGDLPSWRLRQAGLTDTSIRSFQYVPSIDRTLQNIEFPFPGIVLRAILLLITISCLFSCEEYQEGCMDATATNFKVSNQVPCCCEYPKLIFQTTLTNDSSTLSFADTFSNSLGQRYLIRELRFIASDIVLSDSLGEIYSTTDTFDRYILPPDILATDVLNLNSTGANYMTDGRFDEISFTLDHVGELDGLIPEDFPIDHPFRDSSFYDIAEEEWVIAKTSIDVVGQELLSLGLTANELPVSIHISGDWGKSRGSDLIVNFRINVETLFGNVDFSLPERELLHEFGANLSASFEP